ncbi:MAG: hypothetical protein B7Z15_24055, partial [Rhizobiales bacterium 32-66-8]
DMAAAWDQYQYYLPGLLEVASYQGNVYALPTDTDVRMLWYDKSNFEKAGIAVPWAPKSWAEVLDAAQKLKDAGIQYPFQLPAGTKQAEGATMQGVYMALLGADVPEGDRNRLLNRETNQWIGDSPALRRTFDLYYQVYVERELNPADLNYATDIGAAVRQALADDKLGILASGSWEDACLWDCNAPPSREERDALVGWTPWPGSGEPGTKATTNISGGWAIGINVRENILYGRPDATEAMMREAADLAEATALAADTTGRDTIPGYQTVSALIQQATSDLLDGASVDDVIQSYHEALVDEFGEENVITYE